MDGLGNINWFGFSPSIDLLELYENNGLKKSESDDQVLNILLVNVGDQRHLLNSIASRRKHSKFKAIRFYVYEKMLELYARDFLLLSLSVEHPSKRSIQEKTELFLEIYGNLLLRDYTAQYIQSRSNEFIKCITDFDYLAKTELSLFDFSALKFKERDFLEAIFKYWRLKPQEPEKDPFPASKCWEIRLRTYFGTRYDSRSNCYDWDFSMKLCDRKNCSVINNKLYSHWRETGNAFELRDSNYDHSNKTLASGMIFNDPRNGDKTSRRGYFGDIVIGPFLSYGIESENKDFFKKQNEYHKYTSQDVARSNLTNMMQSLVESTGIDLKKYEKNDSKNLSSSLKELKIEEIIEDEECEPVATKEETLTSDYMNLDDCKITFLPLTAFQDFAQKSKYDNFFDLVYFSNSGIPNMSTSIKKIFKPNSLVIFETAKYMIEMRNEQINMFSERIKQIAKENDLVDLSICEKGGDDKPTTSSKETSEKESLENRNYLLFKLK